MSPIIFLDPVRTILCDNLIWLTCSRCSFLEEGKRLSSAGAGSSCVTFVHLEKGMELLPLSDCKRVKEGPQIRIIPIGTRTTGVASYPVLAAPLPKSAKSRLPLKHPCQGSISWAAGATWLGSRRGVSWASYEPTVSPRIRGP